MYLMGVTSEGYMYNAIPVIKFNGQPISELQWTATPDAMTFEIVLPEDIGADVATHGEISIMDGTGTYNMDCIITHKTMSQTHKPKYTCVDLFSGFNKNGEFVKTFYDQLQCFMIMLPIITRTRDKIDILSIFHNLISPFGLQLQQVGPSYDGPITVGLSSVSTHSSQFSFFIEAIRNAIASITPPYDLLKQIGLLFGTMPIITKMNTLSFINPMYIAANPLHETITDLNTNEPINIEGPMGSDEPDFVNRSISVYPTAIGNSAYIVNDRQHAWSDLVDLPFNSDWSLVISGYHADNNTNAFLSALLSGFYQRKLKTVRLIMPHTLIGKAYYDSYASTRILINYVSTEIKHGTTMTSIGGVYFPYITPYKLQGLGSADRRSFGIVRPSSGGAAYA